MSRPFRAVFYVTFAGLLAASNVRAEIGDPQLRTDHPWYPGELAVSTFERLFATQAELYQRVVGVEPTTDEQKALAAWLWRNTHFYHGEEGHEDLFGRGFADSQNASREYWAGLFSDGLALCGTTHSQWTAEMEHLLGHARGRCVGVNGHNSFEVYLTGGPYGQGKWVLLDHDISTVIFNREGTALLSIPEIRADLKHLADPKYMPQKQQGWAVSGLHPDDAKGVYDKYVTAEYLAGYAGPPPLVHLRRGETLRRFLTPGLDDGKSFVFWGRNYNADGIPGPERNRTWVNQPDKMHGSTDGTGSHTGQARYGNAVYTYRPNFAKGDYREGIVDETEQQVTFAFDSPYVIGATPPNKEPWGIYDAGGTNGLVLHGQSKCPVAVSLDDGHAWKEAGEFHDGLDLTDLVKGQRHYWLRFGAGAADWAKAAVTVTTVCQANAAILPQLKDDGSVVQFAASHQALVSAGPTLREAETHVIDGKFGTNKVTLQLATPRKQPIAAVYAAAHVVSNSPPRPDVHYQIEASFDGGKTWTPIVRDWNIPRRGQEPDDFWAQSFCYGKLAFAKDAPPPGTTVLVRFRNDGGKNYLRAEAHLVYRTPADDDVNVTFDWLDDAGSHRESHMFAPDDPTPWKLPTGRQTRTRWVQFEPLPAK